MRVQMLISMAGPTMRDPGDVLDVDADEAARLFSAGFAAPADEPDETPEPPRQRKRRQKETPVVPPVETATAPEVEAPAVPPVEDATAPDDTETPED